MRTVTMTVVLDRECTLYDVADADRAIANHCVGCMLPLVWPTNKNFTVGALSSLYSEVFEAHGIELNIDDSRFHHQGTRLEHPVNE
ncbi:MAG: hypothetical protein ACJAYB_000044 [Psychromonas sp.]|jgi:hypothetical protein